MERVTLSPAVRNLVWDRAKGSCEYCLIPSKYALDPRYHIDHIIPLKQGGSHDDSNLALAYASCNLHKRPSMVAWVEEDDTVSRLYDPRRHLFIEHFKLSESGILKPLTRIAEGTIRLLHLNNVETARLRDALYTTNRLPYFQE